LRHRRPDANINPLGSWLSEKGLPQDEGVAFADGSARADGCGVVQVGRSSVRPCEEAQRRVVVACRVIYEGLGAEGGIVAACIVSDQCEEAAGGVSATRRVVVESKDAGSSVEEARAIIIERVRPDTGIILSGRVGFESAHAHADVADSRHRRVSSESEKCVTRYSAERKRTATDIEAGCGIYRAVYIQHGCWINRVDPKVGAILVHYRIDDRRGPVALVTAALLLPPFLRTCSSTGSRSPVICAQTLSENGAIPRPLPNDPNVTTTGGTANYLLEDENARLKRVVADQAVQIQILKEVNAKKW
jgi:hypothetical protein